jgi:hypothetical protein
MIFSYRRIAIDRSRSAVPQGLKPWLILDALRGAEALLFHSAARDYGRPLFQGSSSVYVRARLHGAAPNANFAKARRGRALPVVLLALMLGLSLMAGAQTGKYPQTIVFMTDFGVVDDSVAICRGVMYSIMPEVRIVDLTHQVTPFSILDGARFLYGATPYYPADTVFVVVIDPTVGSTRKAIVAKSKRGQYFVLPDNGLLTLVEQRDGYGLDDRHQDVVDVSWARHFFSGGCACGARGGLDEGGSGDGGGGAGAAGFEGGAV